MSSKPPFGSVPARRPLHSRWADGYEGRQLPVVVGSQVVTPGGGGGFVGIQSLWERPSRGE
jgi:hypothetical protein